jgi:PAS domain S-box-containing protein
MDTNLRPSGIEGLGAMSWGSHFCLFYETREDLLDILIPYFKVGLANHEFCLCVASEPVIAEEAESALREAVPDFEQYLSEGQVEIIPHINWYLKQGHFDPLRVRQGWLDKLEQALAKGYAGLRIAANISWLEKQDWNRFAEYEGKFDDVFGHSQIIALCAYSLKDCLAVGTLDVVRHHQLTLARREGAWEPLEGAQLKRAHEEVLKLNAALEQRVAARTVELAAVNEQLRKEIIEREQSEEALRQSESNFRMLADKSLQGIVIHQDQKIVYVNPAHAATVGYSTEELKSMSLEQIISIVHPLDREMAFERTRKRMAGEQMSHSVELRIVRKDGMTRWIQAFNSYIEYYGRPAILSTTMDITKRKQAEEDIRRYATRMEALTEISRTFVEAGLDYQSVLNTVAQHTAELVGDSCVITLFSDDKKRSFPVAFYHPNLKARTMMHEALLHTWQGGTDTERYQALLSGNSIYIPVVNPEDFRASLEPEFLPYLDAIGISSVLIVPLQVQGRVIGTLGITRDRYGSSYTLDDQVLLQDLADRAALIIQNALLFRQVQGVREGLEALSRRLLEVQEAERWALTTELHDRVGQNLTGLSINLQNMKALLSAEAAKTLATKFNDAQALVEDTTRQIRNIMTELHPPELEDYGLAVALETYAERAASRGNLELITDLPDLAPPPLPPNVRIALFRAAQEAISNVLKHANATQLEISLQGEDGRVRLSVEDDGQGFNLNGASQKEAPSWGLKIMRERVESIGGKVQIESEPGEGTRVIFEIERQS